jgi:hypothetical protein
MSASPRVPKPTGTLPPSDDDGNTHHIAGAQTTHLREHARPDPQPVPRHPGSRPLTALLGWTAVAGTALFALFAWYSAIIELLALTGLARPSPGRAVPPLFVLHALSGGVALTAAALQLRLTPRLLPRQPAVHRGIGRTYVWAAWITAAGGLGTAAFFDVGWAGKAAFGIWASSWFAATAVALHRAKTRRYAAHRQWMIRSFALALIFMTFTVWQPILASLGLGRTLVYPLALLLSAALNLTAAELWIRHTGNPRPAPPIRSSTPRS